MSQERLLQKADEVVTGSYDAGTSAPAGFFSAAGGEDGSGLLNPEQSAAFLDYMWDATTLAKEGRRIQMRATQVDIDKIAIGQRVIKGATEAVDDGVNSPVAFTKVTVTTSKLRLDWETSTELVEDGIDTSVDDHIARLFATQVGNDIEDLAINADGVTADGFNDALAGPGGGKGFSVNALDGASAHYVDWAGDVAGADATTYATRFTFDAALKALPRKYKANRGQFRFYAGSGLVQDYLTNLTNIGETPEVIAADILRGATRSVQGPGGGTYPLAFGVPVVEVPLFDESRDPANATDAATQGVSDADKLGHVELTIPSNRIWGVKREIEFYSEFKPKKDTTEHTMYLRFGIQVENWDAYVAVDNVRIHGYA